MLRTLFALWVFAIALFAQRNVGPGNGNHRVLAVVPLVGAGTNEDPKRPMLVPSAAEAAADHVDGERPDLLGYTMQLSDDGQFALVEFVVADPMAFNNMLVKAIARQLPDLAANLRSLPVLAKDGSNASLTASNVATLKASLEAAVPGLKLFERGKSTEAEVLSEFRKRKADVTMETLRRDQ